MAITFSNIGLAEPSTLTKVVASVVIARGSTNEHQEVLVIGDPSDSLAMARVLAAKPASTEYAQVVRNVETVFNIGSTAADNNVNIGSITGGRINIGSTAADNVVRAIFSSTNTDNVFRPVFSSTGADNPVVITAGNSSVTLAAIAAGLKLNIGSTAADNAVLVSGNSTVVISAGNSSVTISAFVAGLMSSGVAAGNSSALTVRNVWSSSNADQPVSAIIASGNSSVTIAVIAAAAGRINIGSTAADNVVRAVFSSTNTDNPVRAILSSTSADNPVVATIGTNLQSTAAGASNSSALLVRNIIDTVLTTASTTAFSASTSLSIQSSGAALRSYVVAYSITTTNAGPTKIAFYSSGTMTWPIVLAAVSSAISGVNLAVSAPAYIFRTAASEALTLQTKGSTVAGWHVAVSYFRAP